MEQVFKTFLSLLFTLLIVLIGLSVISGAITARNANLSASNYASEIEAANLSDSVVAECKADAEERYGKGALTFTRKNTEAENDYSYGELVLTYTYTIPLLQIDEKKTITKYVY